MGRVKIKGELVSFRNNENILLDGLLYEPAASKPLGIIVHVHGSYGNFYQNHFLRHMAKTYSKSHYAFLTFNLQAHDGFAEGYGAGEHFQYVGGAVSKYSTYLTDVDAAVTFASSISNRVILQGHSMGCDKVVAYMLKRRSTYDCILLSPSDSYRLQSDWLRRQLGISVEEQIAILKSSHKFESKDQLDWISYNSYGIYYTDLPHYLPVTSTTMLSILEGESFSIFNVAKPRNYFLETNAFVYLGGSDELIPGGVLQMKKFISAKFRNTKFMIIGDAEHMLENVSEQVSIEIVAWLDSLT